MRLAGWHRRRLGREMRARKPPEANMAGLRCRRAVTHPRVLEGALVHLSLLLLELLNDTLVDAAQLVDQVAGGRRLAGVDVPCEQESSRSTAVERPQKSAKRCCRPGPRAGRAEPAPVPATVAHGSR